MKNKSLIHLPKAQESGSIIDDSYGNERYPLMNLFPQLRKSKYGTPNLIRGKSLSFAIASHVSSKNSSDIKLPTPTIGLLNSSIRSLSQLKKYDARQPKALH